MFEVLKLTLYNNIKQITNKGWMCCLNLYFLFSLLTNTSVSYGLDIYQTYTTDTKEIIFLRMGVFVYCKFPHLLLYFCKHHKIVLVDVSFYFIVGNSASEFCFHCWSNYGFRSKLEKLVSRRINIIHFNSTV